MSHRHRFSKNLGYLEHRRIRLLAMPDDPDPVPAGTLGTVLYANDVAGVFVQIGVKWDNGSWLSLSVPPDQFEIVS